MSYDVIGSSNDREAWLLARRTGIGASDSPAILGASPWSSGLAVYAEKIDTEAPIEDQSERLMWGHVLEPVILEAFAKATERPIRESGKLLRSKRWPFMLATLDGLSELGGMETVLEAKNTQDRAGWSDGVPQHVWIQVQHQLAVTGLAMGSVAVLVCGCEFKWADVKRDDEFINGVLIPDCESFWKLVENGGPPPQADGSEASRKALSRLYPQDHGESVALDGEFTNLAKELEELKSLGSETQTRRTEIENLVRAAIGDGTYGALQNGGRFSWKADRNGKRTLRYNAPKGS